uniref:Integrin alpha-PS1-like n=1 Tax=Diabrotica virgifera virgifera TaxID=50390 RepID=A0A6P7H0S8_DIAVI
MYKTKFSLFIINGLLWNTIFCFNFEDRDPLVKKAPEDQQQSYFGFSVAQHSTESLTSKGKSNGFWMLVGAPLGNNIQPGTNHSGALFKCPISNRDDDCVQIETDGKREDFDYTDEAVDDTDLKPPGNDEIKDGQWLGVTVRSQKPGGVVLVCAHRYIKSENLQKFHYGQGLCYLLDRNLGITETLLLCKGRRMENLHQQFGFCQVGTSASFVGDEFALMGAPGPYTWRGTFFGQNVVGDYLTMDKTIYHSPFGDIDIIEKYSYLGMSVGGGHFFNKSEYTYMAGAPRSKMVGQVYLFEKYDTFEELNISLILTGEQFAASFGYELLATDVNNDGYDDLLVGAPFYYNSDKNGGAVYIYYSIRDCVQDKCPYDKRLIGKAYSRFGFAMTSLGDINKDGYNDVAIGAPYEDEHGAVYIYLGSPYGLNSEPSQVIRKKQITTLGYSLSGGLDMDNNGYPDLLVGAFESDRVLLFKTRPIIDIKITVEGNELVNINASNKGCEKLPNNNYTCFSFKTCFSVVGHIKHNTEFNVIYNITEVKKFVNRIWFVDNDLPDKRSPMRTKIVPVNGASQYCQEETVNIKEGVQDILSPIMFRVNYTLEDNAFHTPILNTTSVKVIYASFQKECGSDDVCESNLTLRAGTNLSTDETGAYEVNMVNEDFVLEVNVSNTGESAYEAKLFVVHPKALSYVVLKSDRNISDGIKCLFSNETLVICNIGNPLQKETKINLKLRFEIKDSKDQKLEIKMFVNSTSTELSKHTSETLVAILQKIAKFQMRGKASSNLFYGGKVVGESALKYLEEIGARVIHKYQIDNNGQWDLSNLKVSIRWPLQVSPGPDNPNRAGKWLLYLENSPKLYGVEDGFCTVLDTIPNELHLNTSTVVQDEPENLRLPDPFDDLTTEAVTLHSRNKRSINYVVPYQTTERGGKRRKIVVMDCFSGSAKCIEILCTIRKLSKGNQAEIDIQSRIWNSTLVEDYSNLDWVVIKSTAIVQFEDKAFNISSESISEFSAETIAYPSIVSADTELNWLVIGGAVFVGLLLLILLIFVLYKCGFFKRKRISDDPTLSGNLQKKGEADHLLKELR